MLAFDSTRNERATVFSPRILSDPQLPELNFGNFHKQWADAMAISRCNLTSIFMKCSSAATNSHAHAFINLSTGSGQWIRRWVSDGRPRGALWRSRKLISKEALFVVLEIKRARKDQNPQVLNSFISSHVSRLLKADLLAVLAELQRQREIFLFLKIFDVIKKEPWYKPDLYMFKDTILVLAREKKMDEAMQVWKEMRNVGLEPDMHTYTEVIRGFLQYGSPSDAMNIYEEMKQSPHPPDEQPFRVLLRHLFPHPLLRNKVKEDFMELFPDRHVYDPPEEIFGAH